MGFKKIRPGLSTIVCSILFFNTCLLGQTQIYDSGGKLESYHMAYDALFYDLDLRIDPEDQFIEGNLTLRARINIPTSHIVLDLDTLLSVQSIAEEAGNNEWLPRDFIHQDGKIKIFFPQTLQPAAVVIVKIAYSGHPRVAPRAPWDGGFSWARTPSGEHWIATTCQQNGADVWWPCKDHVSDEPDSMALHFRVPDPLVVASNGRLLEVEKHSDRTSTYHWYISTPINIYNVALNIAPYRVIEDKMQSVAGEVFPVKFWVLPEDYEKGKKLFPEILDHLRFYESLFGPYPFRIDKYGVAQTPHLGMEHQSIIAYGANFNNGSMTGGKDWGFDALHHHELAHEWWGNLVTNASWEDMWLHEGFGSYMQALYVEKLSGKAAYIDFMRGIRRFSNKLAIAPREVKTAKEIYRAPIYTKGAWVLHSLRYYVGDDDFFKILRRMAYPDPSMEKILDGRQCRFATTDDLLYIAESITGKELDWLFEVYLRNAGLPALIINEKEDGLFLKWEAGAGPFPMPLPIQIDKDPIKKMLLPPEGEFIRTNKPGAIKIDPDSWILCERREE